jgi:hypothetical protein
MVGEKERISMWRECLLVCSLVVGLIWSLPSHAGENGAPAGGQLFEVQMVVDSNKGRISEPRIVVREGQLAELRMQTVDDDTLSLFMVVEHRRELGKNVIAVQAELVGGFRDEFKVLSSPQLFGYIDHAVSVSQEVSPGVAYDLTIHVSAASADQISLAPTVCDSESAVGTDGSTVTPLGLGCCTVRCPGLTTLQCCGVFLCCDGRCNQCCRPGDTLDPADP